MNEPIHLLVRLSKDGSVYATSPQAPGLLYGRSSLEELRADLQDMLSFHFDQPGPFEVIEHQEVHQDIGGREIVTRLAVDEHGPARAEVHNRIGRAIQVPDQADALLSAVTNPAGEAVYVCAVSSDTIGWIVAQLDPRGDALTAAVTIADEMLFALPFAVDDGMRPAAWQRLTDTPDTTLSEVIQRSPVVSPPQAILLERC